MNTLDKPIAQSKVFLDNQSKFNVTGVTRVVTANENVISLIIGKTSMNITGTGLKVIKLDVNTGVIEGEGLVDAIKYGKTKPIFRKIFK